jgi:hypothetical protein
MAHIKYDTSHHAGANADARIASRLRNSGDAKNADSVTVKGSSPERTITNVHLSGHQAQHGPDHKGEGNIYGQPRGPANTRGEI